MLVSVCGHGTFAYQTGRSLLLLELIAHCTYKILSTHQPAYLRSLLFPYESTQALRSSSQQLLNIPTVTTDFGRRAFSYCAPRIWNEIPAAIRNAPAVQTFKHRLKTLLFGLNGPLHMTQPPTWRLPASQIRSYTPTLHALLVYLLQLLSASLYVSKRGAY